MRLIDADAIQMPKTGMEVFETCRLCETAFPKIVNEIISKAPTIEPKRGEWIVHKERTEVNDGFIDFFPTEYECSNCGLKQSMYFINSKPSNFCPNCGADMREREGE